MQINRRTMLAALITAPLAGCTTTTEQPADFAALESRFDARLGLFAMDMTTGKTVAHRENERFAICSVFKGYASACSPWT